LSTQGAKIDHLPMTPQAIWTALNDAKSPA